MQLTWRTVGWIVVRVSRRLGQGRDSLVGLRRIGIDEISWQRGQRYLIGVLDHDSGRLVRAAEDRDEALDRFFFELGEGRAKQITHVSADAGSWIANVVAVRCPNAVRCMDPFHVTIWATGALDQGARAASFRRFRQRVRSREANLRHRTLQRIRMRPERWSTRLIIVLSVVRTHPPPPHLHSPGTQFFSPDRSHVLSCCRSDNKSREYLSVGV